MLDIEHNLKTVRERINMAESKYHRPPNSVKLIAVSKTKPVEAVLSAIELGQTVFGENYVQEAIAKIEQINQSALEWHFLGPIQSNKTRLIANSFNWVHSVDRLKIAQRLNEHRDKNLPKLNICLQVNISQEESKAGVLEKELNELLEAVLELSQLNVRGFMAIPRKTVEFEEQRQVFRNLRQLKERAENELGVEFDTLSMGMSADLEAAIAEGATHVRVGTDIFGARN